MKKEELLEHLDEDDKEFTELYNSISAKAEDWKQKIIELLKDDEKLKEKLRSNIVTDPRYLTKKEVKI